MGIEEGGREEKRSLPFRRQAGQPRAREGAGAGAGGVCSTD